MVFIKRKGLNARAFNPWDMVWQVFLSGLRTKCAYIFFATTISRRFSVSTGEFCAVISVETAFGFNFIVGHAFKIGTIDFRRQFRVIFPFTLLAAPKSTSKVEVPCKASFLATS